MIGEKYRNIKLFYGIRDILAIKRSFKQYFIPTRVPHYIPISIPHFIPISVPFRILSPYPFRSAFYPHIRSVPFRILSSYTFRILSSYPFRILSPYPFRILSSYPFRSVPQIRSVPHPYPHFNLTPLTLDICVLFGLSILVILHIPNGSYLTRCHDLTNPTS